jgi:hypothetical protein
MEGQFLVRQIYDDEITYNIIGAAVEVLSEYNCIKMKTLIKIVKINHMSSPIKFFFVQSCTLSEKVFLC